MCFKIDDSAPRWRQRMVYKIVKRRRGYGTPPHRCYSSVVYRKGERITIKRANKRPTRDDQNRSVNGIYVLGSLAAARAYAFYNCYHSSERCWAIIQLEVDPRSFLHQSVVVNGYRMATYRSVKPSGHIFDLREGRSTWWPRR